MASARVDEPRPPGNPAFEGDEVVASRWRRRWKAVRRRVQLAFMAGIVAVPVAFWAVGQQDFWGPLAGFGVLVVAFTISHLWAGARMWMRPALVTDQGLVATRIARFVAPRQFARWADVAQASVEPWSSYGDRLVLTLRGGGAVHTIPGELDESQLAAVMDFVRQSRPPGNLREDDRARP